MFIWIGRCQMAANSCRRHPQGEREEWEGSTTNTTHLPEAAWAAIADKGLGWGRGGGPNQEAEEAEDDAAEAHVPHRPRDHPDRKASDDGAPRVEQPKGAAAVNEHEEAQREPADEVADEVPPAGVDPWRPDDAREAFGCPGQDPQHVHIHARDVEDLDEDQEQGGPCQDEELLCQLGRGRGRGAVAVQHVPSVGSDIWHRYGTRQASTFARHDQMSADEQSLWSNGLTGFPQKGPQYSLSCPPSVPGAPSLISVLLYLRSLDRLRNGWRNRFEYS